MEDILSLEKEGMYKQPRVAPVQIFPKGRHLPNQKKVFLFFLVFTFFLSFVLGLKHATHRNTNLPSRSIRSHSSRGRSRRRSRRGHRKS